MSQWKTYLFFLRTGPNYKDHYYSSCVQVVPGREDRAYPGQLELGFGYVVLYQLYNETELQDNEM